MVGHGRITRGAGCGCSAPHRRAAWRGLGLCHESVDTSAVVAGFGRGKTLGRLPVRRIEMPATLKCALTVSRRNARHLFDAARRAPEAAEREAFLPFGFAQDVAHAMKDHHVPADVNVSRWLSLVAGLGVHQWSVLSAEVPELTGFYIIQTNQWHLVFDRWTQAARSELSRIATVIDDSAACRSGVDDVDRCLSVVRNAAKFEARVSISRHAFDERRFIVARNCFHDELHSRPH